MPWGEGSRETNPRSFILREDNHCLLPGEQRKTCRFQSLLFSYDAAGADAGAPTVSTPLLRQKRLHLSAHQQPVLLQPRQSWDLKVYFGYSRFFYSLSKKLFLPWSSESSLPGYLSQKKAAPFLSCELANYIFRFLHGEFQRTLFAFAFRILSVLIIHCYQNALVASWSACQLQSSLLLIHC